MNTFPRPCRSLAVLLCLLPIACMSTRVTEPDMPPRVVVLTVPSLDGDDVERLMDAGELPHLAALCEGGTFSKVSPLPPNDDMTAWLSLSTGRNPAETGVPGFIKRDLREWGVVPWFGAFDMGVRTGDELTIPPPPELTGDDLPISYPVWGNPNEAAHFWDVAAGHGVPSIALRMGLTFDPPMGSGAKVLAGEGYLDAKSALGEWCIYSTDPDEFYHPPQGRTKGLTAGTVYRVVVRNGRISTRLYGPKDFWLEARLEVHGDDLEAQLSDDSLDADQLMVIADELEKLHERRSQVRSEGTNLPLEVELLPTHARITIGDEIQDVSEGEWSAPYSLRFAIGPFLTVHAITRVKVVRLAEPFELYVDSLDFDPRHPPFWQPLSRPPGFAVELAEACGTFDTYGWGASATMGYKDGEVDAATLVEDVEYTMRNAERLTHAALERDDGQLIASAVTALDRVQHMLTGYEGDEEVVYFGRRMPLGEVIDETYRQVDRFVGELRAEHLAANDTLLVVSPHGVAPFRTGVELNAWLIREGFMALQPQEGSLKHRCQMFRFVDWSRTRAYALGLGGIYLNLEGREPEGIVAPDQARTVLEEIRARLLADTDEAGNPIAEEVRITADEYSGPYLDRVPDLLPGFAPGFRVGWSTTSGGIPLDEEDASKVGPVLHPNDSPWSGGAESVAPRLIPGALLTNRRLDVPAAGIDVRRIAPTVLALCGVPIPAEMDLAALPALD